MLKVTKRIEKEIGVLKTNPPNGVKFKSAETLKGGETAVEVEVEAAANTVYSGERWVLRMICGAKYPFDSPSTYFVVGNGLVAPQHQHVYSNGHICLSILGTDWTPALQLSSVALSVLSMLSSAAFKSSPQGDASYCRNHPPGTDPKKTSFAYDDDNV